MGEIKSRAAKLLQVCVIRLRVHICLHICTLRHLNKSSLFLNMTAYEGIAMFGSVMMKSFIMKEFQRTERVFTKYTDEKLLNHKRMKSQSLVTAMKYHIEF